MRSASEIKQAIDDAREEVDAIVAVAERENRELVGDEAARVSALLDTEIPKLNKQMETAAKIQAERNARATSRIESELAVLNQESNAIDEFSNRTPSKFAALRIPASAMNHSPLQAFKGPDAEKDAYISGQVILAGVYGNQHAQQFCRNHGLQISNTMVTNDNTAGGFLVPNEMMRTIIRLREERGVFPQFANRVPMGADTMMVPRLLSDVTASWVGESNGTTNEITASDAGIGQAEIIARKLGALTKISSELDESAIIDIGDLVTQSIAYAMADKIDEAAFNGDGTSTYGGVVGLKNALSASATATAATGNTGALTLDRDDFEATCALYPQYPGASPRWFMHSAVYWASVARLQDAAQGNTVLNLASGPEMRFLGYPVTFVQVMPSTTGAATSTILAYFGDLRLGATYGVRRSMRTQVSTERYFEYDLVGIKVTERVGILCHERGDTIRNRPIVALKTAAS